MTPATITLADDIAALIAEAAQQRRRTLMSETTVDIVRRRLVVGLTIADSDVHELVREIDRLRAENAELKARIDETDAMSPWPDWNGGTQ